MAFSSSNTPVRLKLLMLWLTIVFGHLGHTSSHYLDSDAFLNEAVHKESVDSEHTEDNEHSHDHESEVCVTCIAFALVALELTRSAIQQFEIVPIVLPTFSRNRFICCGLEISKRPGQPRAPPRAA